MPIYDDLGVTPIINAAATLTAFGGSRMPPEVLEAMHEAADNYVDMHEFHEAAGARIAEVTRNDAAYVTAGCAAAIVHAVLACITRGDPGLIARMPRGDDLPTEVIMHCAHRIPYDRAVELAGARIVQIGNALQTFPWELESAITPNTAAILYVAGDHFSGALDLRTVVAIATERSVPVVVDAAAQLPPMSNLWHFTQDMGADLALFSGGKALRGPQASGLMVGSPGLIRAARENGAPHQRLARAMKAGREEIAGLVRAVERFVSLDHAALLSGYETAVADWARALGGIEGVSAVRAFPNEAGQPTPRLQLELTPEICGYSTESMWAELLSGTPRILSLREQGRLYLTPDTLALDEMEIVQARLLELLDPRSSTGGQAGGRSAERTT